jgi:hypothetical protein
MQSYLNVTCSSFIPLTNHSFSVYCPITLMHLTHHGTHLRNPSWYKLGSCIRFHQHCCVQFWWTTPMQCINWELLLVRFLHSVPPLMLHTYPSIGAGPTGVIFIMDSCSAISELSAPFSNVLHFLFLHHTFP